MTDVPTDLPGMDLDALGRFLDDVAPGLLSGPLNGTLITGGKSNLTYVVSDGSTEVVVRRPPLGHVLATAHDMGREHRVMAALATTDVPVPRMLAQCADDSVLGAPFYVMERVEGTPYRLATQLEPLGAERVSTIVGRLVDTLVVLHAVDPELVGLADFGRPQGYLGRQVNRWKKQMDSSRHRDLPGEEELHAGLAATIPPESGDGGIVHGDYRLDNVLVDGADTVSAVLDWEMATLGDPLTDLATLLVYQDLARAAPGSVSDVALAQGYPSQNEVTELYAKGSGRDVAHLGFYRALACYKLAAILEGIHYRHSRGQTVGAGFEDMGGTPRALLDLGLEALHTIPAHERTS